MEIPSAVIAFTIILGIAYWVNSSREDKAVTEAIKAARNEDVALDIMRDVDRQWLLASLSARVRFQSILFPKGVVYDYENHRFGTTQISTFYRVLLTKKDSEESSKSFLVAGVGFEPTTFGL